MENDLLYLGYGREGAKKTNRTSTIKNFTHTLELVELANNKVSKRPLTATQSSNFPLRCHLTTAEEEKKSMEQPFEMEDYTATLAGRMFGIPPKDQTPVEDEDVFPKIYCAGGRENIPIEYQGAYDRDEL